MQFAMPDLVLSAVAGGSVGFLSGVFGIGGGFLLVPILNIVLRIPMEFAVGAGACQVLGPATTSLLARRIRADNVGLPLTVAGGLFVGVFVGVHLLTLAKGQGNVVVAGNQLPLAEAVVLLTYLLLLLGVGLFALWETGRRRAGRGVKTGWIAGWRVPPYGEFAEFQGSRVSIAMLAWFGLLVGLLAGLLGISGGLILLPGLIYLLGMKTHQAVLSTLVLVWIVGVQSTIAHGWYEHIDLRLVAALLVGGTVGARLGSQVGQKLKGRHLRESFGWLLLATAALIAARLAFLLAAASGG